MVTELNATEARGATKRPRAMILILAGLALAVGWISLPWGV
ncbi:MAG TPA: hypothetical protein VMS19_08060 [Methyloceanibacter sp.]|nr:hypothetical protein [Methyloceanibacter sp.]